MYKMYLIRSKSVSISKSRYQEKLSSVINKKTIRYHLNKVISEYNILPEKLTPLTVVKHFMKTLFWATVYLAFSYLTIISTFEVYQQYHDDQMTTNMKAIINNNVTYFPNMTICLKIDTSKLFNISSSSGFNYTSAWSQFFEESISPEGIFKVNESRVYDDEIYLSLLKYLAMIYEAERAWEPGLTQISTFHSDKSDDWIALKKVFLPNIERYNITLEQLKSLFDGKFCSLPGRRGDLNEQLLGIYEWRDKTKCVTGNKVVFIGKDTICFRLIGYKNYLKSFGSAEYIQWVLYSHYKNQEWCQEFSIDLGSESRSTPRRATTRNETYGYYYNRFRGHVFISMDIGIKTLYRKLPYVKGEIQCSSDISREECENQCLRGWIRANCRCSPITFNLTADTSSYRHCTVDDYSICLKKYAENATFLCTNECVPLCEQWHYGYELASYSSGNGGGKVSLKTFDYVLIEQVFSWNSFEEFIGAMGGALGLWLGLDFVIIIEFVFYLLKELLKRISRRNVKNSEDDEHRTSAISMHGEENVENGISSLIETGSRVVGHQEEYKENGSLIGGTSIRRINESEKQRISRKKRESNAVKEENAQQRRKHSSNIRVDSGIIDNEMKNTDAHDGRLRNRKLNITDNLDAVQCKIIEHSYSSTARSWFHQQIIVLFLNGDVSTSKRGLFLRVVEKLFWVAIYLVGSVFTTLWCIELINLYLTDEAVYFPSLITNRTVSLPPPSLCISYSNERYLKHHGYISNALEDYFSQSDTNRASFIQISGGKPWPEPLVSIGLLYLSILSDSETYYSSVSFTSDYTNQLDLFAGGGTLLRNDLNKSVHDILLPKLLEWNVTANELRQKLGAELARMVELKISFTNSNGTIDIVNEASFYMAAIANHDFCYSLSYGINFTDPDDVLEFSLTRASHLLGLSGSYGSLFLSDDLLDPKDMRYTMVSEIGQHDSTFVLCFSGKVARTLISVADLYTSRSVRKGVKFCSPNTTKSYCHAQCRIKLIEKLCNCSPTYWTAMIQLTSGLDECTFNRYMGCLNYNASDDLDCKGSCLPFCTTTHFQNDQTKRKLSSEYSNTVVFKLSVKDGIYASIEEKEIFTLSDLFITFGGTLGILLGFSIYSFYQFLATTATLCFAFTLKRTRLAQSSLFVKSWDKINKTGIAQLISNLYGQLRVMNLRTVKKNIKNNETGSNILLTIGYMIGLYATVRMSNDLYYSFNTGEPICHVDLMVNDTIKLTSPTICLPLVTVELLSESEISNFENSTNSTRNLYFNLYNRKENFFSEDWPAWLMQRAYEYLIIYDTIERHGNQKLISALLSDDDRCASNESRNAISKYSFTPLMELDELFDHLNLTVLELKQNIGQRVRDIYKIAVFFVKDGAWNRTVLNITDTTFIGEEKVCYKLPLDTVTFSSKSDYISIYLDRGPLSNPQSSSLERPITIDLRGRDVTSEESNIYFNSIFGSTLSFWFGHSFFAKLDIAKIYEAMPVSSGVRRCSETKSMDTCQDECKQKKTERVCNCSPTAWSISRLNTNLTRCHLNDYKRCAKSLVSSYPDLCELNCIPHCTHIGFNAELSKDEQRIEDNIANIILTVNSFEYLSFKEEHKYTTTELISQFGDILGLWIGLDILMFIDTFYLLICKYCYIF